MTRSETLKADARKLRDAILGRNKEINKHELLSFAVPTNYGEIPCRFNALNRDVHYDYKFAIECDIEPNGRFDFYESSDTDRKEHLDKVLQTTTRKYLKKYWTSIGPCVLKICISNSNGTREKETLSALEAILDFMSQDDIFVPIPTTD